jgi:hypothetical protein
LTVAVNVAVDPLATVAVVGATVTEPTGTSETVTVPVPETPSLVAVIVAVPGATPRTEPEAGLTMATSWLLELHVTTRLVTTAPFTSFTTAVKVALSPVATFALGGDTVTLPMGGTCTFTVVDPDLPSLVAVIVVVPGVPPVTTPDDDTVAMLVLPDAHVTTRSVTTVPFWSFTVAVSCVVCWLMTLAGFGDTLTDPTGTAVTVRDDDPDFPSLVAVIVAEPAATPVTSPALETVATAVLLDPHVTTRSVTTVPFKSLTVAESCVVRPETTLAVAGETVTVPTGTGAIVTAELPDFPSLVAVIVAEPMLTPVTTPALETVATAVLLDPHVTTRSVTTVPFTSVTVGVSAPV